MWFGVVMVRKLMLVGYGIVLGVVVTKLVLVLLNT